MNLHPACVLIGLAAAILPGFVVWMHEFRLRKIAEARLGMSKAVTRMNEMMLNGEMRVGEVCHDHICRYMFAMQNRRFQISWNLFRHLNPAVVSIYERLEKELETRGEMRTQITSFAVNHAQGFRYSRPISYGVFVAWILTFRNGIRTILFGLRLLFSSADAVSEIRRAFRKVKCEMNEWLVAMDMPFPDGAP